ncbi:MAG: hypothetical protein Q4B62_08640 [Clostridiaceae bacterium]|nr:hypothetical protein [Clostridiaceae bacterium]
MAKRYLVVIPVNKPPYLKGFNDMNKAAEIMQSNLGTIYKKSGVKELNEHTVMFSAHARKKNTLAVNDRATYFANISDEMNIYGPAIIIGEVDECLVGLTEDEANNILNAVNELTAV